MTTGAKMNDQDILSIERRAAERAREVVARQFDEMAKVHRDTAKDMGLAGCPSYQRDFESLAAGFESSARVARCMTTDQLLEGSEGEGL